VQHTTHPSGSFSPCPYLGGTTWAKKYDTILEQWQSPDLEQLRSDFLANKRTDTCSRCWHEEEHGKRSLRLRMFDPETETSDYNYIQQDTFVNKIEEAISDGSYLLGPRVLTIKNGNICNAKCRSCHPGDSSSWIDDANKLADITGKKYYSVTQQEKNWSEKQLAEIYNLAPYLVKLELFGGEPTYNKSVHQLVKQIVAQGDSKHITLYINTNGSVDFLEKLPEVMQFKELEIGVSIDGVGNQFEYIRHGVNYAIVQKNIKSWQEKLTAAGMRFFIDSITTVSVLNVYYLTEIKQAVQEMLPLSPFWNLLVNPPHLFIANMPDKIKNRVAEKLSDDPEFVDIIDVMMQPSDAARWQEFLEINSALDQIRSETFALTFSEFANILQD
jgi:MoaA/NifB/PqqE/SkfB family radical SAM enzyme